MSVPFKEISQSGDAIFFYLSELLGRPVVAASGKPLGKLADLKVMLGEMFPKVVKLRVKPRGGDVNSIDWTEVESVEGEAIRLKGEAESRLDRLQVTEGEILLKEEILDKQVVDTFGAKIERVNDIHLLATKGELRVVHVDFGARGIYRRLGWLPQIDAITNWLFTYRLPEKMISWKYIQPLASDPQKKSLKLNVTMRRLYELHPSDLADIIEELDREQRDTVFKSLDLQTAAETLEEVDPKIQAALLESASVEKASDIIEEMAPDEATDLLADLPEEKRRRLIGPMEKQHREELEYLLRFEEGTAGSIMTKDFISLQETMTIGDAIQEIRKTTHPFETITYLYVTDAKYRLAGVLTMKHLLLCSPDTPVSQHMETHLVKVQPEDDVEEVVEIFQKYDFLAIPVVDQDHCLRGIITLRDVIESKYKEFE